MLFQTQSSCSTTDGKTRRVEGEEQEEGVTVFREGQTGPPHRAKKYTPTSNLVQYTTKTILFLSC